MHIASNAVSASTSSTLDERRAVVLEHIGVRYRLPRQRLSGLKEFAIRWLQRRIQYDEFWAIRDISLEIQKGETFGIIGLNGAGKSTLLKVIARVLRPSEGRVIVRGKVAPLLELGAGFHPELTGRENVYLNGSILGHSRTEMDELFEGIVDFAELWDFIDMPIRTYSSGMVARLGFSVATCVLPEVLIVDEILSVGDAPFQEKCLERMRHFQEQGTTILFVSHAMGGIKKMCGRAVWLRDGRLQAVGPSEQVAEAYLGSSPSSA